MKSKVLIFQNEPNIQTVVLNELGNFIRKVLFVDKALFHINDHINQHCCQIWGAELPHEAFEFT